jgi:hypothetical protein
MEYEEEDTYLNLVVLCHLLGRLRGRLPQGLRLGDVQDGHLVYVSLG